MQSQIKWPKIKMKDLDGHLMHLVLPKSLAQL